MRGGIDCAVLLRSSARTQCEKNARFTVEICLTICWDIEEEVVREWNKTAETSHANDCATKAKHP